MVTIIGCKKIMLDEIDSTNDYATTLFEKHPPIHGTTIITNFQTNGKGQRSNRWESKKGENILLSTILFPDFLAVDKQFIISKIISLSIIDFLSTYLNKLSIKWPNDIYYKDKKIAGILIENIIQGTSIKNSIIGIGININQEKFSVSLPNPISLRIIKHQIYQIEVLIEELLLSLNNRYNKLLAGNINQLNNDYLKSLYLLGEKHQFKDDSGYFTGTIMGISDIGRLIIEKQAGKIREYNFKEVEF